MEKKKFFGIPEIILVTAMIIQILTAVFGKNVNGDIMDMYILFGKNPEQLEGHSGVGAVIYFFYLFVPLVCILNFFALFVKKHQFVFSLISGIIMLLPALYAGFVNEGIDYVFFFILPELLIISAVVVSGIEKRKYNLIK